jgi:hypothetical protein
MMAENVATIANEMHSSRKARGEEAAREATNADELLSLLKRATEAYSKAKHHGLKDRWRKHMDRLEESLDLFETDEHTNGAIDAQPPDTMDQDVPQVSSPYGTNDSD